MTLDLCPHCGQPRPRDRGAAVLPPAELDALTAWWKAQRHIGKAATLLNRKRQTVANNLHNLRRLEGATDNVELALKYLDEIERRWPDVLRRAA